MNEKSASTIIFAAAIIIAIVVGMVLSAYMLSRFMVRVQTATEKSIVVKGVAEKTIISDIAVFRCFISAKSSERAGGYELLEKNKKVLHDHLKQLGFKENMFEDERINCTVVNRDVVVYENKQKHIKQVFDHYLLTYSVRVRTSDVRLVEKNVLKIYELASRKYDVSVANPEYYISNPEQFKLELVDQASESAALRAETAASKSRSKLGALIKARQGVIQITAPANNDTSDYGVYDTTSVEKVMRLVMTLEFALQ